MAIGAGALAHWLTGGMVDRIPVIIAWLTLTGVAVCLVPWIAWAFERFDVSRDMPDSDTVIGRIYIDLYVELIRQRAVS